MEPRESEKTWLGEHDGTWYVTLQVKSKRTQIKPAGGKDAEEEAWNRPPADRKERREILRELAEIATRK